MTLEDVAKKYKDVIAVADVNLEIKAGEFFTLLGPSGCGKTTTLYSVAGLLNPDEGRIWIGDELVTSVGDGVLVPPQERDIAMVFQDYAIYPHMSVFDNIAFSLQVKGIDEEEIDERVRKTAELLDIEGLLKRKPGQLSGGQRQRVALGRAIVRKPKVFLMDEPLANLDERLRVSARGELKKLQKRLGVTTIYVTHDQVEAMTMSDRIAIMEDGRIQQIGTPEEIYGEPVNLFVAEFIGSPPMNLLEAEMKREDGTVKLDMGSFVHEVRKIEGLGELNFSEVVVGIRPEHVYLRSKEGENNFKGEVLLVEPAGKEVNVHLSFNDEEITSLVKRREKPSVGEEFWVGMEEEEIHIFDRESGRSIVNSGEVVEGAGE